jgi:hypothetical protein
MASPIRYVVRNSDLPEPVVPPTNAWGPWNLSWRSQYTRSDLPRQPIRDLILLLGAAFLQRVLISNSSTVLTSYC